MIKVAPSILSADFSNMGKAVSDLEKAGADYVHVDVMDGSFVEQITFGARMVESVRKNTKLPLDVHLMIVNPEKHIESFAKAGADIITFHAEAVKDIKGTIDLIKSYGIKAGISIKPETQLCDIEPYLEDLDMVLVMTVEPGAGGQEMIESTLEKVKQIRKACPELDIEVDGGINDKTVASAIAAGANVIVAGSYVFGNDDLKWAVESLRG